MIFSENSDNKYIKNWYQKLVLKSGVNLFNTRKSAIFARYLGCLM